MNKIRIAHISFAAEQSVVHTLKMRATAARSLNLPIDFYIINKDLEDGNSENCFFRKEHIPFLLDKLHPYAHSWMRVSLLQYYFPADEYDAIVLRYPKLPFDFAGFLKKYGKKLITEHHTFTGDEIRAKKTLVRKITGDIEDWIRPRFIGRSRGVIAVTDEIKSYLNAGNHDIESITITNGINVNQIPLKKTSKISNEAAIKLLFIASRFLIWHGLDRLLAGLKMYSGSTKINLVLLGEVENKYLSKIHTINTTKKNVYIDTPGPVFGDEKFGYFNRAHIAVGSLALHRNNMKEACPLKVREYTASGLPFIYAYEDNDLSEDQEFAKKFAANDEPIDIDEVIRFANNIYRTNGFSNQMRNFAEDNMDWKIKTQKLYDFVSNTITTRD